MWASTFGAKIHIYHTYNGRFYLKPSRSSVEYSNHTITLCGIGSHHQNFIVERKIQTLTLGAGTLILHEKIYLPEAIT